MIIVNSIYNLTLFTLLVADPFGQLFPWIHRGERAKIKKDKTLITRMHKPEKNSVLSTPS